LSDTAVNKSQSESRVVTSTFIESLQYVVMSNRENKEMTAQLVLDHLIPVIQQKISGETPILLTTHSFYYHTSLLLRTWHKYSPDFDHVLDDFWPQLHDTCLSVVSSAITNEQVEVILRKQIEFIIFLMNPNKFMGKFSKERVKFSCGSDDSPQTAKKEVEVANPGFQTQVQKFCLGMGLSYLNHFQSTKNLEYLKSFLALADNFPSEELLTAISSSCDLMELFHKSLLADNDEVTIKLGVVLLSQGTQEQQKLILDTLVLKPGVDTTLMLLKEILPLSVNPTIGEWLVSGAFSNNYLSLLDAFLKEEVEDNAAHTLLGYLSPGKISIFPLCFFFLDCKPVVTKLVKTQNAGSRPPTKNFLCFQDHCC